MHLTSILNFPLKIACLKTKSFKAYFDRNKSLNMFPKSLKNDKLLFKVISFIFNANRPPIKLSL